MCPRVQLYASGGFFAQNCMCHYFEVIPGLNYYGSVIMNILCKCFIISENNKATHLISGNGTL